eukprot:2096428-Lingulodinium_polyedra.AAC.1
MARAAVALPAIEAADAGAACSATNVAFTRRNTATNMFCSDKHVFATRQTPVTTRFATRQNTTANMRS